jgi:hypothetical protein
VFDRIPEVHIVLFDLILIDRIQSPHFVYACNVTRINYHELMAERTQL